MYNVAIIHTYPSSINIITYMDIHTLRIKNAVHTHVNSQFRHTRVSGHTYPHHGTNIEDISCIYTLLTITDTVTEYCQPKDGSQNCNDR